MPEFPGLVTHPTPAPYPFGPESVAAILDEGLSEHPDRIALIDGDRTWTWAELDATVGLMSSGLQAGQPVVWQLSNCAELVIGSLATFRAGAIWIGTSAALSEERAHNLSRILGELTIVDSLDAANSLGSHASSSKIDVAKPEPHSLAAITFTSGTSGTPKAVAHSQHNLLWPGLISIETEPPMDAERIGTPLRLTILNMLVLGPISALLRGSTYVVMERTYADGLASDIKKFAVTRLFAVPTMIFDLVENDISLDDLASLGRVIIGGGQMDPRVQWDFFDRYNVRPTLSYGLSEAPTGVVRESLNDPVGSGRGFPLPHVNVEIVGPGGNTLDAGSIGEVCLSATSSGTWANTWTPTLGYLGEPDRTAALFQRGRLHTGDLGSIDNDGALSIAGRLSNLIIRGGANIDPIALERQLMALDFVSEALVVGIPDERLGQLVGVLVVLSADFGPTSADSLDLVELAMSLIEASDVPIDALAVVDSLPRNSMGKVVRIVPPDVFGPETRLR